MSHPLGPLVDFLGRTPPFDRLPARTLDGLSRKFDIEYVRRGTEIRALGSEAERLLLIRSGALNEVDAQTHLVSALGEGELAGVEELLSGAPSRTSLRASEDSLLYTLSRERFEQLLAEVPSLSRTLATALGERLRTASLELATAEPSLGTISAPVETLLQRSLVSIDANKRIRQAAQLMAEQRVSALVVTGGDQLGIVTDRDLRNRVVARGLSVDEPVLAVTSRPVTGIDRTAPIFEALLLMLDRQIHHLLITDGKSAVGLITTTDLIRAHGENPIHVVGEINKKTTLAGVAEANQKRGQVLLRLIAAGARPLDTHRVLSGIADAVTKRLIALAQLEAPTRGLAPMPDHCWVVFGSQARRELTIGSDQDNALVLGPEVPADHPTARFIAETVCEGLAQCGYPKCNGEIMAMAPRYRQPLAVWQEYFRGWIETPVREAIMRASIFFDQRAVEGNAALLAPLGEAIRRDVARQPLFIAHMARDALARRPPLGFFRQFVVEKGGEHAEALDLKHRGIVPIVDLARVFALEAGFTGPGTLERLAFAESEGKLSTAGYSELFSAFEFILLVRLKYQAESLSKGESPSSYLRPDALSASEKRHLRDAFKVVRDVQESLQFSHQLGGLAG